MARHFCALLLVFGFAATAATYARPDARPAGSPGIGRAAEHTATIAPGSGHVLDRPWGDELQAAIEDLRLCVVKAYRGVTGAIGVG